MPYTTALFLVLFQKKYRKKELKKNTSEQLRLRTAVEFDDERKRVFCPPTFAGEPALTFDLSPCLAACRGGGCPPDKVCSAYLNAQKGRKGKVMLE